MAETTSVDSDFDREVTRLAGEGAPRCVEFLHDLVTLPSPSRGERLACERVLLEMESLGFQDAHIDEMGNVLGRIGSGPRILAFDAHVDTVGISNPTRWRYDPFRGIVSDGILFGRGASDQKGGLAAIVHGIAVADQIGLSSELTVWVTATVDGEDCVGLAWQRGRMEVEIATSGVSVHGSQPDRGSNAIYTMMPVVQGLVRLHHGFDVDHQMLGRGSLAVTGITSQSPSLTAVPDECVVHVDRRLTIGETAEDALAQINQVCEEAGAEADVRLLHYDLPSWRGFTYPTDKVFPAWETPAESPAVSAAMSAAERVLGRRPRIHRSAFSSHGCATSGLFGIPTVGFGPADELYSHTVNDQIPLTQLEPAMAFYALFPQVYLEAGS